MKKKNLILLILITIMVEALLLFKVRSNQDTSTNSSPSDLSACNYVDSVQTGRTEPAHLLGLSAYVDSVQDALMASIDTAGFSYDNTDNATVLFRQTAMLEYDVLFLRSQGCRGTEDSLSTEYAKSIARILAHATPVLCNTEKDDSIISSIYQKYGKLEFELRLNRDESSLQAVFEQSQYFSNPSQRIVESRTFSKRAKRLLGEKRFQDLVDWCDMNNLSVEQDGVWHFDGFKPHCEGTTNWNAIYDSNKDRLVIRFLIDQGKRLTYRETFIPWIHVKYPWWDETS